jgi:chromosome segregation ATPase
MTNDSLIKELNVESSLLVRKLQSIIDTQGTLLSGSRSADPTITLPRVRRQLWRTMQDLAIINEELADIYMREANDRERQLTQVREICDHEAKIKARLGQIEASDESVEKLTAVRARETELESEKAQLEKRLREVEKKLNKTRAEKGELESVVSSMKSSYLMELEECTARKNKIFNQNPRRRQDAVKIRDTGEVQTEVLIHEIDAFKGQRLKAQQERKALEDGYSVWKSGCDTLKSLESSIKRILTTSNSSIKEKISTEIETALTNAINHLQELLELSKSNEWSLLIVALSQELEALYQSKGILESDNSDLSHPKADVESLTVNSNLTSGLVNETAKLSLVSSQEFHSEESLPRIKNKLA